MHDNLTPAERETLLALRGDPEMWGRPINRGVLESLRNRGLVMAASEVVPGLDAYALTDAGRAALAAEEGPSHVVVPECRGERCTTCGSQAHHKVGEEMFDSEPCPIRHNLTAYLCCPCFRRVMGGTSTPWCSMTETEFAAAVAQAEGREANQ